MDIKRNCPPGSGIRSALIYSAMFYAATGGILYIILKMAGME